MGVLGALGLAAISRTLSLASFMDALMAAVRTSTMIALILAGAAFLSIAMGFTGVPRVIAAEVKAWNLSAWELLAVLTLLYIVLGCFLDGVSMMVLTAAVVLLFGYAELYEPLGFILSTILFGTILSAMLGAQKLRALGFGVASGVAGYLLCVTLMDLNLPEGALFEPLFETSQQGES